MRSAQWFGRDDLAGFLHRSSIAASGINRHTLDGRPVIGSCNSLVRSVGRQHLTTVDAETATSKHIWETAAPSLEQASVDVSRWPLTHNEREQMTNKENR
ncbi:hypothetical protein [Rhodococcus opacus]|uniref:hypothetical protein n=1 Tax=Rhodococcus opacus TaxID=37919 RepID=UPI001C443B58|nr:hypothetical protein [Rhodococcus opacus]MBV6762282.1 hypothetical protein [Rhodococcus opacus]